MNYPKDNGIDATAWLVDFPNPYSHRQLGRNPLAQHQNYPKIDSSTNDYPITTFTFFCVKALSENYPTKWWVFSDYPERKNSYPKVFLANNPCPRQ